ncbi:hypothetical protein FB567DRAFT_529661 [Paraphoma chrysanthemicola]|uniref:2EXR domain-containing protein n=1 Tax=Paraphoma chrysanthemicola TaxID=798071 RepID=A0A8K0R4C6_9PLEO|nr:hypothetical protein FB567DRAFT_529661 [Paraphoma chrysanthemicola]
MATYYYAAYFGTPLSQSPAALTSHHPLGISSHALDLPMTPAKSQRQAQNLPAVERRILFANGKIDEQKESLFFKLPAELRNQIYEELLCPDSSNIKELAKREYHSCTPPALYPAILSTCRKIHEEATDLLYTTHIFHAHPALLTSLPHLASSAKPVLYPTVLAKIKRWQLSIRLDTDPRFTMSQATAAFSGAEYLEIRVWQSMFDGADCSVLRLFLGIRGVKVAKVGGSANPELAKWLEKRMMMPIEKNSDVCQCGNESRVLKCGQCCKKVDVGTEWFSGRNAWQFGNR